MWYRTNIINLYCNIRYGINSTFKSIEKSFYFYYITDTVTYRDVIRFGLYSNDSRCR